MVGINWCRLDFAIALKQVLFLLTWSILRGSNAWSRRSPQRQGWLDCVWQPRPPSPSHRTGAERHSHSDVHAPFWRKALCSLTNVMFTTFFTKAAASSCLYLHLDSWMDKKEGVNLTISFFFFFSNEGRLHVQLHGLCMGSPSLSSGHCCILCIQMLDWAGRCNKWKVNEHLVVIYCAASEKKKDWLSPITSVVVEVLSAVHQLLLWLIK